MPQHEVCQVQLDAAVCADVVSLCAAINVIFCNYATQLC